MSKPEVVADPEIYRQALRELPPVFWDKVAKVWVCSGFPEASAVLRDHTQFRSARLADPKALAARGMPDISKIAQLMSQQMLFLDPPMHTAIKRALTPAFTSAAAAARESEVRGIIDAFVQALPTDGRVDVVAAFAGPLPTRLAASRLGLDDRVAELLKWAEAYGTALSGLTTLPNVSDRDVIPGLLDAWSSLREVARSRLGGTSDDLITLLTNALVGPGLPAAAMDDAIDRVAANCLVLVTGGYQTLTQLVAMGLVHLAGNPDQLAALRVDPSLMDAAVDEIMRLDGSSQYVARQAVKDTELGGQRIRAGQAVVVLLSAANLDPRQFPDPHRFDLRRRQGKHLGFALGRHHCIGSVDAEQAARLALSAFLSHYAQFRLSTDPDALVWGAHVNTRCPVSVVLEVGREAAPRPVVAAAAPAARPGGWQLSPADLATLRARTDRATDLSGERMWMDAVMGLAELRPEAIALNSPRRTLTYGQLAYAGTVLAARLQAAGMEPGTVAAIVMDREVEAYLSALAVSRTGAAFLSAEPSCPPTRLRAMLAEADVRLVCTMAHLVDRLGPQLPSGVLTMVVDVAEVLAAPDPGPVVSGVRPGDTAYIGLTSGSTGTPKAISTDHEALINLQVAMRHVHRITPDDRVLQWFSPNFDGWPFDLVLGLTAGATLVLPPVAADCVGPVLSRTLRNAQVTVAHLTPTAWQTITTDALPALRLAGTAGEVCTAATVKHLAAPGRRVLNLYGPAEAAVWSTWHECHPGEGDPPIGVAVPNKHAYVLDPDGRPTPPGQVGQLWIGGLGVGRYLHRPELMRAKFRPDPLASRPGQLMYATGDLCRWRADGRIDFVGRADRQIKIRGQRVELEEIERVLCTIPGVTHAGVHTENEQLVATVVVAEGHQVSQDSMREHLRDRLHSAMVPTTFRLASRPGLSITGKLDVTGKLDLSAQPEAPRAAVTIPAAVPAQRGRRPATALDPRSEARLVWRLSKFFASCLRLPQNRIRSDSDFFDLGGDSLSVAELLTVVEDSFGVILDVGAITSAATPEDIARAIHERQARS